MQTPVDIGQVEEDASLIGPTLSVIGGGCNVRSLFFNYTSVLLLLTSFFYLFFKFIHRTGFNFLIITLLKLHLKKEVKFFVIACN
jgi:hypothetical protein